jgi:hypothetical protein
MKTILISLINDSWFDKHIYSTGFLEAAFSLKRKSISSLFFMIVVSLTISPMSTASLISSSLAFASRAFT